MAGNLQAETIATASRLQSTENQFSQEKWDLDGNLSKISSFREFALLFKFFV